jgi:hypothetical protein
MEFTKVIKKLFLPALAIGQALTTCAQEIQVYELDFSNAKPPVSEADDYEYAITSNQDFLKSVVLSNTAREFKNAEEFSPKLLINRHARVLLKRYCNFSPKRESVQGKCDFCSQCLDSETLNKYRYSGLDGRLDFNCPVCGLFDIGKRSAYLAANTSGKIVFRKVDKSRGNNLGSREVLLREEADVDFLALLQEFTTQFPESLSSQHSEAFSALNNYNFFKVKNWSGTFSIPTFFAVKQTSHRFTGLSEVWVVAVQLQKDILMLDYSESVPVKGFAVKFDSIAWNIVSKWANDNLIEKLKNRDWHNRMLPSANKGNVPGEWYLASN